MQFANYDEGDALMSWHTVHHVRMPLNADAESGDGRLASPAPRTRKLVTGNQTIKSKRPSEIERPRTTLTYERTDTTRSKVGLAAQARRRRLTPPRVLAIPFALAAEKAVSPTIIHDAAVDTVMSASLWLDD